VYFGDRRRTAAKYKTLFDLCISGWKMTLSKNEKIKQIYLINEAVKQKKYY
jgi:hypothetical protein